VIRAQDVVAIVTTFVDLSSRDFPRHLSPSGVLMLMKYCELLSSVLRSGRGIPSAWRRDSSHRNARNHDSWWGGSPGTDGRASRPSWLNRDTVSHSATNVPSSSWP
jgi:hypothetical protein